MHRTGWLPVLMLTAGWVPSAFAAIQVTPGQSISAAIASAAAGDSVLVQAGTYQEHVTLKDRVDLRGGYDASFSEASRDPDVNRTIIDGTSTGPAITSGPSVTDSTSVDGFVLTGGGGTPGAGVIVVGGGPAFSNNEISQNRRPGIAGGVYVHSGSTASFVNNLFTINTSQGSGGGMRIEHSDVTLVGNTFDNNSAVHAGGALYIVDSAVQCTGNNVFRDNQAGDGGGGGVYVQHSTSVVFSGSTFDGNQAEFGGGMLVRDESAVTLTGNTFRDCIAEDSGGGIGALTFCDLQLDDNKFERCEASIAGGGIWALQCTVDLIGDNAASTTSTASFVDCSATGASPSGKGGGASFQLCTGVVESVRFVNCSADSIGGGLYAVDSQYSVKLDVFESCSAPDGGGVALHSTSLTNHREARVINNTFWGCRGTRGSGSPAGGITFLSPSNSNVRVAVISGNIVANTLEGSCLACKRSIGEGGGGMFLFASCTTVEIAAGNPAAPIAPPLPNDFFNPCLGAFNANGSNHVENPKFCSSPPADYSLQDCSPAVGTNIECAESEGKQTRGATPDNTAVCPCQQISVEAVTWGKLKNLYR